MLRLSKKADYALIALSYMAAPGQRRILTAREVAERHSIPLELLAKVLQRLVRAGVLGSIQGVNGGYQLAKAPHAISVAQVVEAIDGPLMLTACGDHGDHNDACDQFDKCSIRDPLQRIRERIASELAACSIEELASPAEPPAVAAAVPMTFHAGGLRHG